MKEIYTTVMTSLGLFFLALANDAAMAQEIPPGRWHIVTEGSTMLNGQQTVLPRNEMDSCVTAEKAKQATDLQHQPQEAGCQTELLWKSGSKAKTRTICPTSTATTDFDFAGNSYRSVTHMESNQGNMPAATDVTVTGTRSGDCPQ